MAISTADYQPGTGRSYVDLTSWAGSFGFAVTPSAGMQIEYPDALTVNADGSHSGPDGTYTVRLIQTDGSVEAITETIGAADTTAPVLTSPTAVSPRYDTVDATVDTDEANGTLFAWITENASEPRADVVANGISQSVTAVGTQSVTLTELAPNTTYYVHFAQNDAVGNESNLVTSPAVTTGSLSASRTVDYAPGFGKAVATLAEGYDQYIFREWATDPDNASDPGYPVPGDQIVYTAADFTLTDDGVLTVDAADIFDAVFIDSTTGQMTGITLNTIGVPVFQSGAPVGTVTLTVETVTTTTAVLLIDYDGTDATGFEYSLNGGSWVSTSNPVQLSGLATGTLFTVVVRPTNEFGSGGQATEGSAQFTTTSAVDVTPAPFSFVAQDNVARGITVISNAITVQGVDAGVDVPVLISGDTGSQYSVSTDGGTTWGGWTSASTNVRLNYRIRVRHTSSSEYSSGGYDGVRETTLSVGGVTATFTSTTLADTTPPVITLTGGNVTVVQGEPWVDPGYSAYDAADGNIPANEIVITGTVNSAEPGSYPLTYSATDRSGNTSTATRMVTVVEATAEDLVAPVITLIGGNITLAVGDIWQEPGYEATDNIDGDITDRVQVTGTVNTAQAGTNTVTYTVMDTAGNIRTATRKVYVVADVSLTILAPSYRTVIPEFTAHGGVASEVFYKAPRETLDFDIDLTDWVAGEFDAIDAELGQLNVEVDNPGLTILSQAYLPSEDRIKVWLSGGTNGAAYTVSAFITTINGRRKKFIFRLATQAFW